jgi:hypothetical protein
VSACRSCGAPILWAVTPGGRRIPLDADPDDAGNIALDTSSLKAVAVFVADADGTDTRPRYRSHFASCPQAEGWRRS